MKVCSFTRGLTAKTNQSLSLWNVLCTILMLILLGMGEVCAQVTTWVSKDSDGNEGNSWSEDPSISADGRYVTFGSISDNLVPNDSNWTSDVFVHDRERGETTRVSVDSDGNEANGYSMSPSISANGRYVVFSSRADNLVQEDTNGSYDIFAHDRETGETTRVSVDSRGNEGSSSSGFPALSADGRYVVFSSVAKNLVRRDFNGADDIFVHDRETGETIRVSVDSDGNEANSYSQGPPSISPDGRFVAFESRADNLVPDDTNGSMDIFVHDREMGKTTRVSIDSGGNQANSWSYRPSISAEGRHVAFETVADNLVPDDTNDSRDICVHDRETGETIRVSVDSDGKQSNEDSWGSSISADGRYVAFTSRANNLVPQDTNEVGDVFVHDYEIGEIIRISVNSNGDEANYISNFPSISAEGSFVAYESMATNLVPEDTYSSYWDYEIFVHGPLTAEQLEVSIDIAPNIDPNRIRPEFGVLDVAILTVEKFDAIQVDPELVRFGPDQAEVRQDRIVDIDSDGDTDLVLSFQLEETGIACGDSEATLTGETFQGVLFSGTDSIVTIGCRKSEDN
jgi:Tol biopolymer transport system component